MYYRVIDGKIYDKADWKYSDDCLQTSLCSQEEFDSEENIGRFLLEGTKIVVNPDWKNIVLEKTRALKFQENSAKCNTKLSEGSFTIVVKNVTINYLFNDKTKNDLSAAAIGFLAGVITEKEWTGEEGNTVKLSQENVAEMLMTLDAYGNPVWAKWGDYQKLIEKAKTKAALDKIVIDYNEVEEA